MKDRFILDSSIWVELERENKAVTDFVTPLIHKNKVCLVDVILTEILRGAKSPKHYKTLQEAFGAFNTLSAHWENVSHLAFQTSRKGYHPPLIDLYIAQCAYENRRVLITQDKHFLQIAKIRPLRVKFLPKS